MYETKMVNSQKNILYFLLALSLLVPMCRCAIADEEFDKGRTSYHTLRANAEEGSERAGCMEEAFLQLNATCASLNDTLNSYLTLRFTICHYQSTQRELPQQYIGAIPTPDSATGFTNSLTENAFIIYTQFSTHTWAFCYFIEAKLWQERTERTIHRLGDVAVESADKIERSLSNSDELIRDLNILQIKASELIEKYDTLHSKIDQNQDKMDQLSRTITDYNTMITEILSALSHSSARVEHLVNLVLGETQDLSPFLLYFAITVITFVLTVPSRTNGARLRMVSVIVIHFLLEILLFAVTYSFSPAFHALFTGTTYYTRSTLVIISLFLLMHTGYNYRDYEALEKFSSTPFKICLSKPVPVKDIDSTLPTVLTLEYDSGVEDCNSRSNRPIPTQSLGSRYNLRERK